MNMQSMSSIRQARQAGFTLIELIVVIVILGILAATALPKFADLGKDARISAIKGARGAIETGSAMAHGKFLVSGGATSVTLDGTAVSMLNGYPDAEGILTAAGVKDFSVVTANAAAGALTGPIVTTGTQMAVFPTGATNAGTCYVLYGEAAVGGAPSITSDTAGC